MDACLLEHGGHLTTMLDIMDMLFLRRFSVYESGSVKYLDDMVILRR